MMNSIPFQDRNFRLACLEVLLSRGYFADELAAALAIEVPANEYVPNAARLDVLQRIDITQQHLDEIESLAPDGGDDIYFHVFPSWGGEEEELYIASFADLPLLRNLQSLAIFAVATEASLRLADVVRLPRLTSLDTDWFYISPSDNDQQHLRALADRGVSVTITGSPADG